MLLFTQAKQSALPILLPSKNIRRISDETKTRCCFKQIKNPTQLKLSINS
jgi:hypothetical protein